jgi:hypothetical protein
MTLSLLRLLKAGPPPPKVVLLPDALFFTRAIPVATESGYAAVAEQVELALETLSPFPPAQLYYGYFWKPGADRALVFAAYRRRFTGEQIAEWNQAEIVLPAFAALLGGDIKPQTIIVVPSEGGLTALYYDTGTIPAQVVFRPIPAEASEAERIAVRDALLGTSPLTRQVILTAAPIAVASRNEREFAFRAEAFGSRLLASQTTTLDVRDKAELASFRRSRVRDLALWRVFVGLIIAILVMVVGEFSLMGARLWDKSLKTRVDAQQPVVDKIDLAQTLTTKINELSSKRLLPIEMILFVGGTRPETIRFLRTSTDGLHGLNVEAQSTSPAAVSEYRAKLSALPELEKVEFRDQQARDNVFTFTMLITFRPDALKPNPPTP